MKYNKAKQFISFSKVGVVSYLISKFNKAAGRRYFIENVSQMPGIPAKLGQLLINKYTGDQGAATKPEALLTIEEVKGIIKEKSPALFNDLDKIADSPYVASIGQVHQAQLKNDQVVAIKIRYPHILENMLSQKSLLLEGLTKFGPAKKFGIDSHSFEHFFNQKIHEETNYLQESQYQQLFKKIWTDKSFVIVPHIYSEYTTEEILVQSFEESYSLDEVTTFDQEDKEIFMIHLGTLLITSIIGTRVLHSDMQPSNFGLSKDKNKLVLYDFGSIESIDEKFPRALIKLLVGIRENIINDDEIVQSFVDLGFDEKKLLNIKSKLYQLSTILFRPLIQDGFWDPEKWNLAEEIDTLLQGDKWWFRTSGSPQFLYIMRSVQYFMQTTKKLKTPIPLKNIFYTILSNYQEDYQDAAKYKASSPINRNPDRPESPNDENKNSSENSNVAKNLMVSVKEGAREVVYLEMPVNAVESLEDLMPPDVREKIEAQGYNLIKIKEEVIKSGKRPQIILDAKAGKRNYKVWLK